MLDDEPRRGRSLSDPLLKVEASVLVGNNWEDRRSAVIASICEVGDFINADSSVSLSLATGWIFMIADWVTFEDLLHEPILNYIWQLSYFKKYL
jgi:hypothetical protein